MLFNSTEYLLFLPIVFAIFWLVEFRFRWIILLIASYFFYMSWNPLLIVLISGTTLISFTTSLWIESTQDNHKQKFYMSIGVISSLIVLFYFKYFGFFLSIVSDISSIFIQGDVDFSVKLLLPVGISFYTFQTLSYVIDVYRGDIKAERHLGYYALFVSFFPQLVAGPIERPKNLLPQLHKETFFKYDEASYGIKILIWGFFKKIVIADYIALYVNQVYNNVGNYSGFSLVIATFLFAVQIYCDFSGYTDIAIGSAKLLGINLMKNFHSPYFSQSIREFWSRWHISLSTWFKDYLYIPLGGNRVSYKRYLLNLFLTFLISGIWHGANWTFVIWGAMHGAFIVVETIYYGYVKKQLHQRIYPVWINVMIKMVITFVLVMFSWVIFRSNSLEDAFYVYGSMLKGIFNPLAYLKDGFSALHFTESDMFRLVLILLMLFKFDYSNTKSNYIKQLDNLPFALRTIIYLFTALLMIMTFTAVTSNTFVYFQF